MYQHSDTWLSVVAGHNGDFILETNELISIRPFSYLFFAAGHEGMTELHAEVGFGFSGQEGKLAEVWVTGSVGYPLESVGHIYAL